MIRGEQDRRAAATSFLAGRDALTTPRRIRERPGTDPRASRVPGATPVPVAARGPPSVGRGVAGLAEPPTPGQSAPRDAAARRNADTPGHRVQRFAASAPPTDTHRPGTACRLTSSSASPDGSTCELSTPGEVAGTRAARHAARGARTPASLALPDPA